MLQLFKGTRLAMAAGVVAALFALPVAAQVTPAAGVTPADDNPSFKVGATIFADYTYNESPEAKDSDGNLVHNNSFNVSRAYINITGNLNHLISFRITPDVSRETGSGASLAGSQEFRLKYAFAQLNLEDWTTKGSWVRFGVQQTPYVDYTEGIYRYRFQGTIFGERIGELVSSDAGLSGHYNFPNNYGDVHAGFYNGEGYNKAETNNEKAFQVRGSLRPLPLGGIWKGLRVTGFYDADHNVQNAKRTRAIGQVTFESAYFNGGFDYISAKDRTSVLKPQVDSNGWSFWLNPRMTNGWEALLRHDNFKPNKSIESQKQKRDIDGIAYWLQNLNKVQCAVMLDRDSFKQSNFTPVRPTVTNYEVKMLINF